MGSAKNKEIEQSLFEIFKHVVSDVSEAQLINQPNEPAADMLLSFRGRSVALEITRVISDERKRQWEAREEKVLREIRVFFEAHGNLPISLRASFAPHCIWKRDWRTKVTPILAQFVEGNAPPEGGMISFSSEQLPEGIQGAFDLISMDRTKDETHHYWGVCRSGWFPELTVERVAAEIAEKEENLEGYRQQRCEEVWLLLTAEGLPSFWWEVSNGVLDPTYRTAFDKVFVMVDAPWRGAKLATKE